MMKTKSFLFPILLTASFLSAEPNGSFPSLPSKILSNYNPKSASKKTPESFAKSANFFLASLNKELRAQAALTFDSSEKAKWTNVPPRGPQGGVRLGDLNKLQIKAALNLLSTVLSEQGYNKARNIPLADDRLLITVNAVQDSARKTTGSQFSVSLLRINLGGYNLTGIILLSISHSMATV